jgi:hypothetical protein
VKDGNKLNKIEDANLILQNISSAKEESSEIYVWRFVGNTKHLGLSRIEAVRKQRNDFCIVPAEGQDRVLQDLISGQTHIDIYIPSKCLLMRCRLKQTDAPFRYYLEFPQFIAQAERRKELRLNVYDQQEIKVSFGKTITVPRTMSQFFLKSCFDVSTGGLSFFVSKSEAKLFSPQDAIKSMEIKSDKWSTKVSSQVLSIRETEPDEANGFPYKVWRISCQITQIDPVAKKQLEKFIFERIKEELHAING